MMASQKPWIYYCQFLMRLIIVYDLCLLHVQGTCYRDGIYISKHTIWQPDSCTVCSCQENVAVCEAIQCKNPNCDFQARENLWIPASKCCPECDHRTKACLYQDKTYQHNTEWTASLCSTCICDNGKVHCTNITCNPLRCKPGQILQSLPATCCQKCVPVGRSCIYQGQTFRDGEEWKPAAACTYCTCRNGQVECYVQECLAQICTANEKLFTPSGGCCPRCVELSCIDNGVEYQSGSQWKPDACTFCTCNSGKIDCIKSQCDETLQCSSNEHKTTKAGDCCPKCVSIDTPCEADQSIHYSGEIWKKSDCEYCICDKGSVHCHLATCEKVTCTANEEFVHQSSDCCPECLPSLGMCTYQEKSYQSGDSWAPDGCQLCTCNDSHVTCFKQSCHVCPEGTIAYYIKGQCCPLCKTVECGPECTTCGEIGPNYCLACRDNHKVLQNGRCLDSCDATYYLTSQDKCEACHPSCATCSGKAEFQCTSCWPEYLLKWGLCVNSCGSSFYEENGICFECHPTCEECTGPGDNQCLDCSDVGKLLQDGECVDDCGSHFYTWKNHCHACKSSCESCHTSGLACSSCSEGQFLQDQTCVSSCSAGYYSQQKLCLGCHPSCVNCTGPSSSQCTVCKQGWALFHGECLADGCGDSYFIKNGKCTACHPTCLKCCGTASTECLSCMDNNAFILPLPGQEFGQCIPKCPDQYYLTYSQLCFACHESCKSCYGPGPISCTACHSSFLLKDGSCVSYCDEGYFTDNSLCVECHPSCQSCSGWGPGQCISCAGNTVLEHNTCIPAVGCSDGQFKDKAGECKICPERCKSCYQASDTSQITCTLCKSSKDFLKDGGCINDCGRGYFSSPRGVCKKCHTSCKTCNKDGVYGCLSCHTDLVLTHLGFCTTHCFDGYYPSAGACTACDSTCSQCDEEGRCIKCRDLKMVIQFGECTLKCADQHYMDHSSKLCKECDWSCESCKGPHATACVSCMQGMFLQHGTCVQSCQESFFPDGSICKACPENCLNCSKENICNACTPPSLLLNNKCVSECSLGKYIDYSQHFCIDCPTNCLKCSSPNECFLCNKETFLKVGSCVQECGNNYYTNIEKFQCEANFAGPVLVVNGSLIAEIGGETRLDTTFLTAYDLDTDFLHLSFSIIATPSNGYLVKVDQGQDIKLGLHDVFTSTDLSRGVVRFVHDRYGELHGESK